MKRNTAETILGAVVILAAVSFLIFGYRVADLRTIDGYELTADFAGTGGLKAGDDVLVSGVKVGSVKGVTLVPDSYLARVHINIASDIKLPEDTAALISSESLLGGRYLALEPGADENVIPPGGRIQYTQAPQNLEQLLGQFIFSMQDGKDKKAGSDDTSAMPTETPAATKPEFEPHTIPEVVQPAPQPEQAPKVTPPAAAEGNAEGQDAQPPSAPAPESSNAAEPAHP